MGAFGVSNAGATWPPVRYRAVLVVPRFCARMVRRSLVWAYERRLGVQTTSASLASASRQEHMAYHPSSWRQLRRALGGTPVGAADVFLDLGAGLGRILIQASMLPFGRVVGVELSPELAEHARSNLAAIERRRRCGTVELITADAARYQIPDEVTFLHMYNPFTGQVFQQVVDNITASLERNPRRLVVIYTYPLEEARLLAAGAKLERKLVRWRPSSEWRQRVTTKVYTLEPQAAAPPRPHM